MSIKNVKTSPAYIDSRVHVFFCTSVFGCDREDFLASVGDEVALSIVIMYNMSQEKLCMYDTPTGYLTYYYS